MFDFIKKVFYEFRFGRLIKGQLLTPKTLRCLNDLFRFFLISKIKKTYITECQLHLI